MNDANAAATAAASPDSYFRHEHHQTNKQTRGYSEPEDATLQ